MFHNKIMTKKTGVLARSKSMSVTQYSDKNSGAVQTWGTDPDRTSVIVTSVLS